MKKDELMKIFHGGYTHADKMEVNKPIISYDNALCMYDYADIILKVWSENNYKEEK